VGQRVTVTGQPQVLGKWNPNDGLVLHTSPAEFPVWRGGVALDRSTLTNPNALEYKYVIIDENPTSTFRYWEALPGNRNIDL